MSAPTSNFETAADTAKEAAQGAFAAFQEAGTASSNAGTTALMRAMEAGDTAIALEPFAPRRAKQRFLKESTGAKLATIKLCVRLAQGRERIEKEMANVSQISTRGALKLLRPAKEQKKKPLKPNPIAWRVATARVWQEYFDQIDDVFLTKLSDDQKRWLYAELAREVSAAAPVVAARNPAPALRRATSLQELNAHIGANAR